MYRFRRALRTASPRAEGRRWLFVPYDQLHGDLGPLGTEDPSKLGIVLIENPWKAARRPYHKQKLALVLANQRHFALEQASRGVAVEYRVAKGPYRTALGPLAERLGPLRVMEPAERELREDLAPLVSDGALQVLPHEGWLTTREQFLAQGDAPWRMDVFYRRVRRDTGLLMQNGKPLGGKYSFDPENRKPWKGSPPAPSPPRFEPDEITQAVGKLVEEHFARHPGNLDLSRLPASQEDAQRLWQWAMDSCLENFGPYEDAMSRHSSGLFHTRISPLLNLHRLLPRDIVRDVIAMDLPLPSQEGFLRQVLGWREFVRHVHRATDGFRQLPTTSLSPEIDQNPGDGGWEHAHGEEWRENKEEPCLISGGARPSFLEAHEPLPKTFWGNPSGLNCLDHVVREVWQEGYSHHITRLMILSNLATLLDLSPRQLTDWFWVAYIDAYDWVVEPNVLGMGTFAAGELMTTKPYVSGAAYIHRMSDYCSECRFNPKTNCPITSLYWAFLDRHREKLSGNRRLALPLRSLERRSAEARARDQEVFRHVSKSLQEGQMLRP